jgi:hypothetical protein
MFNCVYLFSTSLPRFFRTARIPPPTTSPANTAMITMFFPTPPQSFPFIDALSESTSDARVKEKAPGGPDEPKPSSLINLFLSGAGDCKILAPDQPEGCLIVWECELASNPHALQGSLASEVDGVRNAKPRNTSSLSAVEVSSY